jgi:hypothetical protein
MALRGDKITLKALHTSVERIIAESTSVNVDFSAEFLETTSQSDGLNQTGIQGKVSGTISGDFLYASDGDNFATLFGHMNSGTLMEVTVYRDSTAIFEGDGVLTSLSLSGGLSDSLATGSYSIQCSGNMAV